VPPSCQSNTNCLLSLSSRECCHCCVTLLYYRVMYFFW